MLVLSASCPSTLGVHIHPHHAQHAPWGCPGPPLTPPAQTGSRRKSSRKRPGPGGKSLVFLDVALLSGCPDEVLSCSRPRGGISQRSRQLWADVLSAQAAASPSAAGLGSWRVGLRGVVA